MKASDLFLRCLETEGVTHIFGVPGEENADLMMSLLDSEIQFVVCRHEQGAAFMADVYGRLTGTPGVCLGTLGPGATNLVTGVANAHFDRSPLVAITGQAATTRLHKESHQNMDVVEMFTPVTKWSTTVRRAEAIPEVVRKAFRLARLEKPGATHVELPEDVAKEPSNERPIDLEGRKFRRPAPDHKAVARAVALLREARSPLILAGNGCVRRRASKQLQRLVDQTGVHVTHTFMGKGVISDRDPHSLFVCGLGSQDHINQAFAQADLVVTIGYDMIEWPPDRWNPREDQRIVHIDFEPAEVDNHYRVEVEVVCDVAAALWEINEQLGSSVRYECPQFEQVRRRLLQELAFEGRGFEDLDAESADFREARAAATSDAVPMTPQRILRDLRAFMDDTDILISDVGAHKMWVARHYPAYTAGSVLISNGFCSMGIALPGALAAKMVHPDRKAVALCGDGGFLMNVQELATAVQYEIPSITLVWEDHGYGLIAWKQEMEFGKTSHTAIQNPDLVKLAESFGAFATRVEAADGLRLALDAAARETSRPSVVVVPVDYRENMKLTRRLGKLVAH
jgi:acetolactate synthase-1/2/3 large subunit